MYSGDSAYSLGIPGYLPEYVLWGTRVGPGVPDRVRTLGVPGYQPDYALWGYPGTYPIIYSLGVPGYLLKYDHSNWERYPGTSENI